MRRGLLLSGGIDSTAVAWWKRPDIAYTIDYGHSAAVAEIQIAKKICKAIGCRHQVLELDASTLGAGPLAGKRSSTLSRHQEWWPFRNQFLLTVAGMHAVQLGVRMLMIGSVCSDSRHADGKKTFLDGISRLMSQQEGSLRIEAPALAFSTEKLVRKAKIPLSMLLSTHSCHTGNVHCCDCPGCRKRLTVFAALGLTEL